MNIAFSKNGKSIKFLPEHFSASGGDTEAGQCIRLLANNNPDHTFYIIGRSEFSRLTDHQKSELFDYHNVVDVWSFLKKKSSFETVDNHVADFFKANKIEIDAHVMMVGQIGTVTIPGKIKQIKDPSLIASTIEMVRGYSSPINIWQNDNLDIPVIEICNDPRYRLDQSRDMIFKPKASLSQYDEEYIKRHIISYADQTLIYTPVQQKYAEMEKIFLYDRKVPDVDVSKRTTNFSVVLNEGNPSRYKLLNEWVLKKFNEVDIYGVWDEKYTSSDSRFKGSLKLEQAHSVMQKSRCTFCIPIAPGWVTSKYIEMIFSGVIPFLHPTYDDQNHTKVPEFLRPKTKEELYERIAAMEDDIFYMQTIERLQEQYLKPEYLNGTRLNQIIMQSIDSEYTPAEKTAKETDTDTLEGFF